MKIVKATRALIIMGMIFSLCAVVLAKDVDFEITVDRNKVGLGQVVQLFLTFNGTQDMPTPALSDTEGYQVRYLGPSSRMSVINNQVSSSITHRYALLFTKRGMFKIGPLTLENKGDTYHSNAISIDVAEASQEKDHSSPGDSTEAKDLSEHIFLVMQLKKNTAYVNEIVPMTIKLFVNRLGVRDIQYPQFSHEGISVGEFERPKQYREIIGGITYEVVEFDAAIFGLRFGEFRLGPASLQCNVIVQKYGPRQSASPFEGFFNAAVFKDFFGEYGTYPYSVSSTDILIKVLPLPEENKPEGFSGALGVFDFEAAVNPAEAKVGDPVILKVIVRGDGNFGTVNLPKLSLGNDFKIYEPQVKQEEGAKTFEQVLIPLNLNIKEIPAFQFSFFNTQTGAYKTVSRGPFPVKIGKPEKEDELKVAEGRLTVVGPPKEEELGRDIIYIKENLGPLRGKSGFLYKNKIFLGFQVVPLLCYFLAAGFAARNRRLKTDLRYARQLLAPRKAKGGITRARNLLDKGSVNQFYDTLFETLQEYLGDKFHLPSKGITINVIDDPLRKRGVSGEVLEKLTDIFRECDMVRYAASQLTREDMRDSLKKLEEVIDYFQRHKV